MKQFSLFFTVAILASASLSFAQRPADWSVKLTGKTQQIILQNLTGIAIVQTDKAYIGIDPVTQKAVWTVERKASKFVNTVFGADGSDFYNMAGTPFVLISNNMLESRTGAPVISKEKNGLKTINDFELIPALNSALVRTTTSSGMLRLYLVGLTDAQIKWETDVMKPSAVTFSTFDVDEESEDYSTDVALHTTLVTPDKHLIFRYQKMLAVISPEGKLLWAEKINPAEVMLSPDGTKVLCINTMTTGIGNSPVVVRNVVKFRGTKLMAYDLKTGKPAWKEEIKAGQNIRWADAHPDFLTVVVGKSCNIYKYATGQPYWAEDFKGKRVVEILPNDKGFLVTYESGYKTMQLSKTGKELWKKPEIVETEDGDEDDSPEEGNMDIYEYAKGKVLIDVERIRFKPAKGSGLKKWRMSLNANSRIAYDDSLKNIILLHDRQLYIVNPDQNPGVFKSYKAGIESVPAFHTVEFREKSYFMTSSKEFVAFDLGTEKFTHRYYAPPFDTEGLFLSMAHAELSFGRHILISNGIRDARTGAWKASRASAGLLPPGAGNTEFKRADRQFMAADGIDFVMVIMPPARFEAFKQSRNFAWYFAKLSGKNTLVKVQKDTGEETDKLIFDDARPIYQVDEIQKRVYYGNGEVLKVFNM